ncbi:unnamed protein product [Oppiella nova]|uniref:Cytochrome P450 n=1 Tax=Oppiella nova TaxID=334625 RepID=A0A7R9MH11_9ACAR|nr:unnamed protein product [Oppiella nova]CAG2177114.1 unnamed protein product [Oppiella nova]
MISIIILLASLLFAYYICLFYLKTRQYPPGPTPLPLIGNVLMLRHFRQHWNKELTKLYQIYGPVITLWLGPMPIVFIGDVDVAREAFAKIELTGRTNLELACLYCNEKHQDFSLNNNMASWWALRNVMHKAIRKYAKCNDLSGVVDTIVTDMTANMIATNQPINPTIFAYNMSMSIMGHFILNEKCVYIHTHQIMISVFDMNVDNT